LITDSKKLLEHLQHIAEDLKKFKPTEKNIQKYSAEAQELSELDYKVISYCQQPKKRKEILEDCLDLTNQTKNFITNIEPLLKKGLIAFTLKDRPTSKLQKYVITKKGKVVLYLYAQINNKNNQ
jgi:ATP-dependent DNA helicase RecG